MTDFAWPIVVLLLGFGALFLKWQAMSNAVVNPQWVDTLEKRVLALNEEAKSMTVAVETVNASISSGLNEIHRQMESQQSRLLKLESGNLRRAG